MFIHLKKKISCFLSVLLIINSLVSIIPAKIVFAQEEDEAREFVMKPMVAGGNAFTLVLSEDGKVFGSGKAQDGQLAGATITTSIENFLEVIEIAAGNNHALALKSNGTVWAWGRNDRGQLGDGSTTIRNTPVQVSELTDIVAIAANGDYSLALKDDGTVWAWGRNDKGQLGDGSITNRSFPVQAVGLNDVISISAGNQHSLAVKKDGTVWAWGANGAGRLGDGTTTDRFTAVQVSGLSDVISVSAGKEHSLALKSEGTVLAWGHNGNGKLGDGTTTNRSTPVEVSGLTQIVKIATSNDHSLALKENGTVWAWGNNGNGRLGDNTTTHRTSPIQVSEISSVYAISTGNDHSLAIKTDGTLWAWGSNGDGRLGDGTTTNRLIPVKTNFIVVSKSGNAKLANLVINTGNLNPIFNSNIMHYTVEVDNSIETLDITPTLANKKASIKVEGDFQTSGMPKTISLNIGENIVTIIVTSEDGLSEKTYTLTINRAESSSEAPISIDPTILPWKEIDTENIHATNALVVNNRIVLANKNSGTSKVKLLDENGTWHTKLSGIAEVRTLSRVPGTDIIYLVGSKDASRDFYISRDAGETWANLLDEGKSFPGNIGSNNIDSLWAESETTLYIAINNIGLFRTIDGGSSWTAINGNLPMHSNQYKIRNVWSINGTLYAGLKEKAGIYLSNDQGQTWSAVNGLSGLTTDGSREPRDIVIDEDIMYMATKDGVWQTNINNSQSPWVRMSGTVQGKEVVKLTLVNGVLYCAVKDGNKSNIHYYEDLTFKAFNNTTEAGVIIDEFSDMDYHEEYFYVAHKKGLLKISMYNSIPKEQVNPDFPDNNPINPVNPILEWQEIDNQSFHATNTLVINNRVILANKNSNVSNVKLLDETGIWHTKLSGIPEVRALSRVAGTETIYLVGSKDSSRSFYVTRDGGENWIDLLDEGKSFPGNIGSNNIDSLWAETETTLYMAINNIGLFRTTDGGSSWTAINGDLPMHKNQYKIRNIWSIDGVLYAGLKEKGGIYLSTNNGQTWSPVNGLEGLDTNDSKEPRDILIDGNTLYMAAKDGVWYTSINNQQSWKQISGTPDKKEVVKLSFISGTLYCAVKDGTKSNIYYYEEGAFKPFTNRPQSLSTVDEFFDMDYNDGYFYVAHKKGLLKIAQDWDTIHWNNISGTIANEEVRALAVLNNGRRYIATTKSGRIYVLNKESRLSSGWELSATGGDDIRFVGLAPNSQVVYAFGKNSFYISNNNGETWTRSQFSLPEAGSNVESALLVSKDEIYVVMGEKGVFHTLNGGQSWRNISQGLPTKDKKIKGKVIHEHNSKLYLGLADKLGVYVSSDNGEAWESFKNQSGLTEAGRDVRSFFSDGDTLYMGTKDGVWRISENGSSWEQIPGEIFKDHDVIAISRREDSIFAFTKKDNNVNIYEAKATNMFFNEINTRPSNFVIRDGFTVQEDGEFAIIGTKAGVVRIKLLSSKVNSEPDLENPNHDNNDKEIVEDVPIPKDYFLEDYDVNLDFELIEDISDLIKEISKVTNDTSLILDSIWDDDVTTIIVDITEVKSVDRFIFEELIGKEKTITFEQKDNVTGRLIYSWTFKDSPDTIKGDNDSDNSILDLTINFTSPNEGEISELAKIDDIFYINFKNHGQLPIRAIIKVKVDEEWLKNKDLYLYYYNPMKISSPFELIAEGLKVDEEGYVEFELDHNSDYILVSQTIDNSTIGTPGEAETPKEDDETPGEAENPKEDDETPGEVETPKEDDETPGEAETPKDKDKPSTDIEVPQKDGKTPEGELPNNDDKTNNDDKLVKTGSVVDFELLFSLGTALIAIGILLISFKRRTMYKNKIVK
jgi:alpha-tubulin suppressor-like RCC1 family protein